MLIHAISEIGVRCPDFTGVDDKARNSRDQKRKEVRSESELGGKDFARQRLGGRGHRTNKGEGRNGDSNHVRLCQEKLPGDR